MAVNTSVPIVPSYSFTFSVEASFDSQSTQKWVDQNSQVPFLFGIVYVILIALGKLYMKNKTPMDLKWPMFIWNLSLALFSVIGAIRVLPELIHGVRHFGLRHSICNFCFYDESTVTAFWTYAFVMSKNGELLDTFFLIIRKRNVIFLHWFHHCSVLVFTWLTLKDRVAMGRWYMNMNYCIHSAMYTYYALSALKIRLPKICAIFITVSQVLQMIAGFYISVQGFVYWLNGEECDVSARVAILAISLYGAYGLLFVNFFLNTYIFRRNKRQTKAE